MFTINYKVSKHFYNDFIGDEGYYQIACNEKLYGDIYPDELEDIMGTEYLCDWFEEMLQIAVELNERDYIALSNIESYILWLEFVKKRNTILISVVRSVKQNGVGFIVYDLPEKSYDENSLNEEKVVYKDFIREILTKSNAYINEVKQLNLTEGNTERIKKLCDLIFDLEKIYEQQSTLKTSCGSD